MPNLAGLIGEGGRDRLIAECMMPGTGFNSTDMGQSVVRSVHTGGVFVALADASVRFISDFIETGTMPNAANPCAKIRSGLNPDPTNPDLLRTWQRLNLSGDGLPVSEY
jgi:hypothetical protein